MEPKGNPGNLRECVDRLPMRPSEASVRARSASDGSGTSGGAGRRREAPRALDLDRANEAGIFHPVTANNITINFYSPYVAADGTLLRILHYNLGYRGDEVSMDNRDLYRGPRFSFSRNARINSPKGTISLVPPESLSLLPTVSLSYGQAFHINDPRIGTTDIFGGTIVSKARAYQLVASKTIAATEFRVTMAHV